MKNAKIALAGSILVTISACVLNTNSSAPTAATPTPFKNIIEISNEPLTVLTPTPIPTFSASPVNSVSPSPSLSPSPSVSPTPVGKPKPTGSFAVTDATAPNIFDSDGVKNQFSYEVKFAGHNPILYFGNSTHADHLPWKTIGIYWGVGNYENIEPVAVNGGTTSDLSTWEFSHGYPSYQLLTGRTLCIEVKDNWDVKRVVCGKFSKDNFGFYRVNYCSGFGLENPASPSALIESVVIQCNPQ